jgi:hypothetical protein
VSRLLARGAIPGSQFLECNKLSHRNLVKSPKRAKGLTSLLQIRAQATSKQTKFISKIDGGAGSEEESYRPFD